jgi:hypothetical protein
MKRFGVGPLAAAVVGAVVLVQCGGRQSNSSDTNTNWLRHCDRAADCSGALECVSGVCTRLCSARTDCAGFGADAVCSSALAEDAKACTLACSSVSECPGAADVWSCRAEACVPVADSDASSLTEGGAGGVASVTPAMGGNGGSADPAGAGQGEAGAPTGGGVGPGVAECDALSQAISAETAGAHACTAVVRLAYETRAILGYELLCARYGQVDEATARQAAYDDTGYGLEGTVLSGQDPEDEYVFYESPGDFGGVGVVSVRNGITVFGGSIVWSGTGEITYPTAWRPASEIGPDCVPTVSASPPAARGIDLSGGQGEMDQTRIDAAMNEVWATALPDGMWRNQYVFDAMVLLYPRTVGIMNPATAEWIVLVNFGWLE